MAEDAGPPVTGSCLCGAVHYSVHGPLRDVILCHCTMCRRAGTHLGAFSACAPGDLVVQGARALRWYQSSPNARRGFCGQCGSNLFWEPTPTTHISIAAGSLNAPTGLTIREQIFCASKGDYYELAADIPCHD
jgi:hypothetical protein